MSARKRKQDETGEQHAGIPGSNSDNTDFETAMQELENVIGDLEQEDLKLDHALKSFEDGVRLMRICENHLSNARGKITRLLENDKSGFAEKVIGTTLESFLHQDLENE